MVPFKYCQVLGPFNTGTNLMSRYLNRLYFHAAPVDGKVWKHSVLPRFLNLQGGAGQPDIDLRDELASVPTLYICMVRLPYFWLLSTLRRKYSLQLRTREIDLAARLRSQVRLRGQVFANPVQLWNQYYRQYERHRGLNSQFVYVRLEDLVLQPEQTLNNLQDVLKRKPGADIRKVIRGVSSVPSVAGNTYGTEWKEKYRVANINRMIASTDLGFINSQLDLDLLKSFNYPQVWIKPEIM